MRCSIFVLLLSLECDERMKLFVTQRQHFIQFHLCRWNAAWYSLTYFMRACRRSCNVRLGWCRQRDIMHPFLFVHLGVLLFTCDPTTTCRTSAIQEDVGNEISVWVKFCGHCGSCRTIKTKVVIAYTVTKCVGGFKPRFSRGICTYLWLWRDSDSSVCRFWPVIILKTTGTETM